MINVSGFTEYILPLKEKPKTGYVYFLWAYGTIVYIGKTLTLETRIRTHLLDRLFDRITVKEFDAPDLEDMERDFIEYYQPIYNGIRSPKRFAVNDGVWFSREHKVAAPINGGFFKFWKQIHNTMFKLEGMVVGERMAVIDHGAGYRFANIKRTISITSYTFNTMEIDKKLIPYKQYKGFKFVEGKIGLDVITL